MEEMKLQDQCCTLKQGFRLMQLGIKMKSIFSHMPAKSGDHGEYIAYGRFGDSIAPAFTVGELGVLLNGHNEGRISLYLNGQYAVSKRFHPVNVGEVLPTEAQARAALLIYLIEEGKIIIE